MAPRLGGLAEPQRGHKMARTDPVELNALAAALQSIRAMGQGGPSPIQPLVVNPFHPIVGQTEGGPGSTIPQKQSNPGTMRVSGGGGGESIGSGLNALGGGLAGLMKGFGAMGAQSELSGAMGSAAAVPAFPSFGGGDMGGGMPSMQQPQIHTPPPAPQAFGLGSGMDLGSMLGGLSPSGGGGGVSPQMGLFNGLVSRNWSPSDASGMIDSIKGLGSQLTGPAPTHPQQAPMPQQEPGPQGPGPASPPPAAREIPKFPEIPPAQAAPATPKSEPAPTPVAPPTPVGQGLGQPEVQHGTYNGQDYTYQGPPAQTPAPKPSEPPVQPPATPAPLPPERPAQAPTAPAPTTTATTAPAEAPTPPPRPTTTDEGVIPSARVSTMTPEQLDLFRQYRKPVPEEAAGRPPAAAAPPATTELPQAPPPPSQSPAPATPTAPPTELTPSGPPAPATPSYRESLAKSLAPEAASAPVANQPLAQALDPNLAPAPSSTAGKSDLSVGQFLTGIKAGEGVAYSRQSSTGAIGAYGLTGDFIKQWAPGAGLPTDRQSYKGNAALQDQLATYAATQMHNQYGSWPAVSNAWLTGSPTKTTSVAPNMRPADYNRKVMAAANAAPADMAQNTAAAANRAMGGPQPAPAAQGLPGSQTAQAGGTPVTPSSDERAAYLKKSYDAANQGYQQQLNLAAHARHPEAAQFYHQQADRYYKQMDDASKEAYKLLPSGPPQTMHEGEGLLNPKTGEYSTPIPKVESDSTEVKNWKAEQADNKARGLPEQSLHDFRMEKSNANQASESLLGVNGQPVDQNLTGPDVLKAVPPQVGRMSQAMIEGRIPIPNLTTRTDPVTRQAVLAAQAADRTLNVGDSHARVRVLTEFMSGGPSSPAARMTAGNNAINHIDEANYYAQQLHDLGFDSLNAVYNAATPGSSEVGKALSGYKTAVKNFAGEVVKFNTGNEGSQHDRDEMAALFSPNLTAGERKTAMESQIGILSSNMSSLQKRWRDGMGPLVPMFETIHPDSLQSIERIKGNAPYPSPGGLPPSMREPTQGAAPQAAPAQPAQPPQAAPAAPTGSPTRIQGEADYNKLPSGATYISPDGQTRTKR